MPTQLHNLDELVLKVRDPNSRTYIEEAIRAYGAGALRAAVTATWTATTYDLLQKIRELSHGSEAAAKDFITRFDAAVQKKELRTMLIIEDQLLATAMTEFEMLLPHEVVMLERLKADRHLCAHPAFAGEDTLFQPMPEAVHTHIVHAIEYLLQHAPMQGKSALTRIFQDVTAPSFPLDQDAAAKFLEERYLKRAKPSLIRNLVIVMLKKLLKEPVTSYDSSFAVSLFAISRAIPTEYERAMKEMLPKLAAESRDDARFLNVLTLCDEDVRCWDWLDEPSRIKIRTILKQGRLLTSYTPQMLRGATKVGELATLVTDEFAHFDEEQKLRIMELHPIAEFVPIGIERFASAFNYRGAERIAEKIILPMAKLMSPSQLKDVLRAAALNRQIYHAAKIPALMVQLFDETKPLLKDTSDAWKTFLVDVRKRSDGGLDGFYYYSDLEKAMTAAGL
ncbi:MAG: hypothetical protein AAB692_04970 [Patescibacteria group bacterium]